MGYVYRLTFPNGKEYIGITTGTPEKRFAQHAKCARGTGKYPVYAAWRKHGAPDIRVIAIVENKHLAETEVRAIQVFGTLLPEGYNVDKGGSTGCCDSVKPKLSAARKSQLGYEESLRALHAGNQGRIHSARAIANMSAAQKGRVITTGVKRKISETLKNRPGYKTTCEKLAAFSRNLKHTEATKVQISNTMKGKTDYEDRAAKLRTLATGRKHSESAKEKIRAARKAYFERILSSKET